MSADLEDVNSLVETAAYLKLTERKVAQLARERKIGAIREDRQWLFPRAAILTYIEQHTRAAVPPVSPARPVTRGRTFP